jgi:hypothetical protein
MVDLLARRSVDLMADMMAVLLVVKLVDLKAGN